MSGDDIPPDFPNLPKKAGTIIMGNPEGAANKLSTEQLTLRRVIPEPVAEVSATVTQLRFEAPQRVERTPRLFETIRIVDLARFRQSLRRHKAVIEKKGGVFADAAPSRAGLLAQLETHYHGPTTRWPDVVVIRRPGTGVIETNFAILGETIFFGAHLSSDWTEGRESDRFYDTLKEALLEQGRALQSQFEPVRPKALDTPSTEV